MYGKEDAKMSEINIKFIRNPVMERLVITEKPAYTFVTVLANIGGVLGLTLGASAVSCLEFVLYGFLALLALTCLRMRPSTTANPPDGSGKA